MYAQNLGMSPVKIHVMDIKNNKVNTTYIVVGSVDEKLRKELENLQDSYNNGKSFTKTTEIQKFYGKKWQNILGVYQKSGGFEIDNLFLEELDQSTEKKEKKKSPSNKSKEISELVELEKEISIIKVKEISIEFVFDYSIYPIDKIIDFRYKIELIARIPIYRQHIWVYRQKHITPVGYNVYIDQNYERISIAPIIQYYKDTKKDNNSQILGVPVDMNAYSRRDDMKIEAMDTFMLIQHYYNVYGITDFYVSDMNDIIDKTELSGIDKLQLEIFYYGFVLLYYPMMTFPFFLDYIKGESGLKDLYPQLCHSRQIQYVKEKNILDTYYALQADKKEFSRLSQICNSSVAATTVTINNYQQDKSNVIMLRELFDIYELNETVVYMKLYTTIKKQTVIIRKAYHLEPEPKENINYDSIMFKVRLHPDKNEFLYLSLFRNGNYVVRTEWREDMHMNFDKIQIAVSRKVNPIIKEINRMSYIKYVNKTLPYIERDNIYYTDTTLHYYCDINITDAYFDYIKKILNDYTLGGILHKKDTDSPAYEAFLNKGMYNYDLQRMEKAFKTSNYYEYLTDSVTNTKWTTLYTNTRLTQISNASGHLKIVIHKIRDDTEMDIAYSLILTLLKIFLHNAEIPVNKSKDAEISKKNIKTLKAQDPLLYDFKRIYNSDVVYSKICQKPYQPQMLNDEDYKGLNKARKKNAVLYWNFTKQKPVWYSCPNIKYPYIKFIVKEHPKNYCIPCCKKIEMSERVNIKKQQIHNTCMKDHIYEGEKTNITKGSHYIMIYGKDIEVGRISRLPEDTLEPLFFDTYSPEGTIDQECIKSEGFYLLGIEQNLSTISKVGYIHCLAHSLTKDVNELLEDAAKHIRADKDIFKLLLDRQIYDYFNTPEDLAKAIVDLKGKLAAEAPWNNIFQSIAYHYLGINTILFCDEQDGINIDLVLPRGIKKAEDMFPGSHQNLIIIKKNDKYYPVYLINVESYKQLKIIENRLFVRESGIITIIKAVVRTSIEDKISAQFCDTIDLSTISEFAKDEGYKIVSYFVNKSNLCYGLYLQKETHYVYFPIEHSKYVAKSQAIHNYYDSNMFPCRLADLMEMIKKYNKWVEKGNEIAVTKHNGVLRKKITIDKWLVLHKKDMAIGFTCRDYSYYCDETTKNKALSYFDAPIQRLLYNPAQINKIISNISRNVISSDLSREVVASALYEHYIYDLLYLEFSILLNSQKNTTLRRKLYMCIMKTDFNKDVSKLRDIIANLEDENDKILIKTAISKYLMDMNGKKKTLIDSLDRSYFEFDKIQLNKLRNMTKQHIEKYLYKIIAPRISIGTPKMHDFPNSLISCTQSGKNKLDYCKGSKLIISKEKIKDAIDIISSDIVNPMKSHRVFNTFFITISVSDFRFKLREGESITIEFVQY